jgi:hypothetical protein
MSSRCHHGHQLSIHPSDLRLQARLERVVIRRDDTYLAFNPSSSPVFAATRSRVRTPFLGEENLSFTGFRWMFFNHDLSLVHSQHGYE